jgi:hypothetical protein
MKVVTHHFSLNVFVCFRLHFHNPVSDLDPEEESSALAPLKALVPEQHQYANLNESSGASDVSAELTSLLLVT